MGTYFEDNGGEFAKAGIGWLKWQLIGDESATAKGLFTAENCGLCSPSTGWTIRKKGI